MITDLIIPRNKETKFIFFSGKGGVGKSTMSCATAAWLAKKGYKILLVTTDPAPNLSDIFKQIIGSKITRIKDIKNLSAIEIDPDVATQEYKDRVIAPMRDLLDEKNLKVISEQLNSPCVSEVAAFDKFIEFMDVPEYDVVIFDTAPTGHTLRLLELPSGWSNTLKENASTCIGPGASLQTAKAKYEKAISYLQDSKKTSFIFVLRPENSSILETKRSTGALEDLGIKTSFLIVNGIMPKDACTDDFFKRKSEEEQKMIEKIENELKIEKIFYPLMDSEVLGLKRLYSVGDFLFEGNEHVAKITLDREKTMKPALIAQGNPDMDALFAPTIGKRYIFFTGKGGVGKSTVACTTAVHLAEKGYKTLIVTTDPASHLHDIFGQEIGHEPTMIKGFNNLNAARIDPRKALEEYKQRILEAVKGMAEETKKSVEEDLNSPCAEEMSAFEKFMSYFEPKAYEIIIFDTAPTGHTLRLLELPTNWKGFIDLGTLTKNTSAGTKKKYTNVIETMKDTKKSLFAFVMYPEYTPIVEAWRASEDLKNQVGIKTSLVVVNYMLPGGYGNNSFFDSRRKQQKKYMGEIRKRFDTPMLIVPLFAHEPRGVTDLKALAKNVFGD